MSVVIATGFAVGTTDGAELSRIASAFRRSLAPVRIREHARLLAERTCMLVDRSFGLDRPWTPCPLSDAFGSIDDAGRESDARGTRAVFEDFGMTVSLIPDAATGRTYGLIHCERADWRRRWMRIPGMRDFHYQDSSDRPRSVSVAEWEMRRSIWERVMPSFVPADHGFEARIFPTRVMTTHDRPLSFQPSLESRRLAMAREALVDERVRADDPSDVIRSVMRQVSFLATPEGRDALVARAATIRIPRRVTMDIARARSRPADEVSDLA